jgi:lysophospholipase L1-like esterase
VWADQVDAFNDQIRRLYRERPEVTPGPDLFARLEGRQELFGGSGDVHPNADGVAVIREAWVDTALHSVYRENA